MLGKSPDQSQLDLFRANLRQIIDLKHPLVQLAQAIDWPSLEQEFSPLYAKVGLPAHPVRKMAGLLLLKHSYNLSDELLVQRWRENPYMQYFCGEAFFQKKQPCAASDLPHFRKRLGEQGIEKLFQLTLQLHAGKLRRAKALLVDTTVQEKNITYPTDAKLYKKIIHRVGSWAKKLGVKLRQSYKRITARLSFQATRSHLKKSAKQAGKALRKLKTIAGRQVRDITRKLEKLGKLNTYQPILERMQRILAQKRTDKHKIYSLHESAVSCIAKGKAHKRYEFGTKVSVATLPGSNLILSVQALQGNPHDGKTLAGALQQAQRLSGKQFTRLIVDKGYRGHGLSQQQVILPGKKQHSSPYARMRHKKHCKSRSAIEAVISHLKNAHRMGRNYLKGTLGDTLNALLAATGFNLNLWMRGMTTE